MEILFGDCACCSPTNYCKDAYGHWTVTCLQIVGFGEGFFSNAAGCLASGAEALWDGSGMLQRTAPCACQFIKDACLLSVRISSGCYLAAASVRLDANPHDDSGCGFKTIASDPTAIELGIGYKITGDCGGNGGVGVLWIGHKSDGLLTPVGIYTRTGGDSPGPATIELEACPP